MRIWECFPALAQQIRSTHEKANLIGHHDWVHAFRVGEVARQIALDEWREETTSFLAGIAGMAHNADRIIQKKSGSIPEKTAEELLEAWLQGCAGMHSTEAIITAVISHDRKNPEKDPRVLIALMDADRVVNLDADLFARAGQHYANLPVVDYKNFLSDREATYRNPKSVLRDIAYSLDWVDPASGVCVRTRKGLEM